MSSPTAQQMLDAVNECIMRRLAGDAYEEYSATAQRFRGTSLDKLYDMRIKLQNEVNAQSGNSFALAIPFDY